MIELQKPALKLELERYSMDIRDGLVSYLHCSDNEDISIRLEAYQADWPLMSL